MEPRLRDLEGRLKAIEGAASRLRRPPPSAGSDEGETSLTGHGGPFLRSRISRKGVEPR